MAGKDDVEVHEGSRRQIQGLPIIRRNAAGIDLGSEQHWVCAPTVDGESREVASFGATTPELIRLAGWLKTRRVESVAMESTGVYWIAPHEVLEGQGLQVLLVDATTGTGARARQEDGPERLRVDSTAAQLRFAARLIPTARGGVHVTDAGAG